MANLGLQVPLEQILRLDREWHGLDRWLVRAHADVWRAANNNIDRYAETGIAGTSNHYTVCVRHLSRKPVA